MIGIDGSMGEGGGQILRTSAALAAVTRKAFRIENIRANRREPGIRPQHLKAIEAVARLCDAEFSGLEVGSKSLEFIPGEIRGGKIKLDIGTAGSITLVLQALMVPAMHAKEGVRLEITGGTDVAWSPPIDYLRFVTLPLLEKIGYKAKIEVVRRGYYPKGGGLVRADIEPVGKLERIDLTEQGKLLRLRGVSHAHQGLEKAEVAGRQMKAARKTLFDGFANQGYAGKIDIEQEYVDAYSFGSGVVVWAETENSVLGADALGERGKRAEEVGKEAAERLLEEIKLGGAVDRYMADQLIPYLALSGGRIKTGEITKHAKTNAAVANEFGFDLKIEKNTISA